MKKLHTAIRLQPRHETDDAITDEIVGVALAELLVRGGFVKNADKLNISHEPFGTPGTLIIFKLDAYKVRALLAILSGSDKWLAASVNFNWESS